MKQKAFNSLFNKEYWLEKNPQFFNFRFQLITYAIDAIFIFYSIISVPLYIFYHIFGDLGLFLDKENIESNPSLESEYLENYRINDISLFRNIFNNLILIGLIIFGQQLIKVQTFAFYIAYMGIHKLFIFAYLMNINFTWIPHKTSFIYKIFNLMIIFSFASYIIYSFFYHFHKINPLNNNVDKETGPGKYKINLNEQPISVDKLVNEIQLRMDMAKIKFNSIMIKLKLHKIFKRILYQPKDLYFMNSNKEKEKLNNNIVRNIKGFKKKEDKSDNISQNSDNISTTFGSSVDNNYSRLEDEENEPLKI